MTKMPAETLRERVRSIVSVGFFIDQATDAILSEFAKELRKLKMDHYTGYDRLVIGTNNKIDSLISELEKGK